MTVTCLMLLSIGFSACVILILHQGVENQAQISKINAIIESAFASGVSLGPDIPWRPVDYFQHMQIPSDDILKCSVVSDSSVDRRCLQDVMSTWNARHA